MRTLREMVTFTGVTGTAGLHIGEAFRQPSMRSVAKLVPRLNSNERASMREMILGLQKLPPITLEAELVSERAGHAPLAVSIRVQPSDGVVLETVLNYFLHGEKLPTSAFPRGFVSGDPVRDGLNGTTFNAVGSYTAVLTRTGISNVGVTVLEKRFTFAISVPAPAPGPAPAPSPTGPRANCRAELDLDQPGLGGITGMRIFGSGFQDSEPVDIIENGQVATSTQANSMGWYSAHMGVLKGNFPVEHTVHARGRTSGRISNHARFNV